MPLIKFLATAAANTASSSSPSRFAIPIARLHLTSCTSDSRSTEDHRSTRRAQPEAQNTPNSSSAAPSSSHSYSYRQGFNRFNESSPYFVINRSPSLRSSLPHVSFHTVRYPHHHLSNHISSPYHSSRRSIHTSSPRRGPDPYTVLGVSRDASTQDIKKRYRELAKQYHPDLNPGPEASTKMAAISSAYQVLSDPKQKQFFDQTGMSAEDAGVNPDQANANPFHGGFGGVDPSFMFTDFTNFFTDAFGGRSGGHVHKGEDIATEVTLDFLDAAKGCRKAVHLHANSSCGDCSGTGCSPGTSMSTCRACSGTGTQKIERGPIIFGTVCSRCGGSGQIVAHPCKACKGSGTRSQPRAVDLDFPAGIRSGMELRISGQGHAGARGGRSGDLFVKVNVRPHSQFKLVQNDVHVTVPLTLKQCLLGGETFVPTLDGKLKLIIAPGTAPGEIKVLRGKGIKKIQERGYGDIAVHWSLEMPTTLTERQKELIEEFDNIQFGRGEQQQQHREDQENHRSSRNGSSSTTSSLSKAGHGSNSSTSSIKQGHHDNTTIHVNSSNNNKNNNVKSHSSNSNRSGSVPPPPRPPSSRKTSSSSHSDNNDRPTNGTAKDGMKAASSKTEININQSFESLEREGEKAAVKGEASTEQTTKSGDETSSNRSSTMSTSSSSKSKVNGQYQRTNERVTRSSSNGEDASSGFSPKSWFHKKFGKMNN